MSSLDWILFAAYLAALVAIGVKTAGGSRTTSGFFVADRSMPWWAVGLSVMATQLSAITLIGTTGLGYADGLRFAQFYFGMPLAMAVLAVTLVPLYHEARVFTAYELLGRRFDGKTRLVSGLLFLALRSLSLGIVVYAPSLVLSMLLGWDLATTTLLLAAVAIGYTVVGGIRAVIWTDVLQMLLILAALGVCLVVMADRLPAGASVADALELARLTGRTRIVDLSFDPSNKYTLWSGLVGGTFLFLAYFGCDQSQVQRFLSGRSLRDNRLALLLNAVVKIPLQLVVLSCGVLLFVVFHFERPPLLFDSDARARVAESARADELSLLERRYADAHEKRADAARGVWDALAAELPQREAAYQDAEAALRDLRDAAGGVASAVAGSYDDTNTIFPYFVLNYLPAGIAGLLLAAIFAAAMSSFDSEVNALATTSVVDLYQVHVRPGADDAHYVFVSRVMTVAWGAAAAGFALLVENPGAVVEVVNAIGSYFYGALLGVFALAYASRSANGHGAFAGLLSGMVAVALAELGLDLAWLWLTPLGCGATVAVGWLVSRWTGGRSGARPG